MVCGPANPMEIRCRHDRSMKVGPCCLERNCLCPLKGSAKAAGRFHSQSGMMPIIRACLWARSRRVAWPRPQHMCAPSKPSGRSLFRHGCPGHVTDDESRVFSFPLDQTRRRTETTPEPIPSVSPVGAYRVIKDVISTSEARWMGGVRRYPAVGLSA